MVGDYTGQPAGEAAQAVRRAGLRPGLERSFGCEATLLGLVVAQEPPGGSALVRNGMVVLHVGAPSETPTGGDTAASPTVEPAAHAETLTEIPEPADAPTATSVGAARRRRKPGRSGRAPEIEVAPAPMPLQPPLTGDEGAALWGEDLDSEPANEVEDVGLSVPSGEDWVLDEPPPEELVVHVGDLFARGARTRRHGWRPGAPRRLRAGPGVRGGLAAHRKLAGVAGVAVGLWVLLAVAGAIVGQHSGNAHRASSIAADARNPRASARPTAAPRPRRATARRSVRAAGYARSRRGSRTRAQTRVARRRAPVLRRAAVAPPVSEVPARVSAPAQPVEQSQGGPFSP
ncbi:MAG TPA: PASTA domain-containing protein [Solirubrobacteraceae bacterium]|nr:PASTA domain-containing protein [Solirubrobacteraceae bacterium]